MVKICIRGLNLAQLCIFNNTTIFDEDDPLTPHAADLLVLASWFEPQGHCSKIKAVSVWLTRDQASYKYDQFCSLFLQCRETAGLSFAAHDPFSITADTSIFILCEVRVRKGLRGWVGVLTASYEMMFTVYLIYNEIGAGRTLKSDILVPRPKPQ